MREFPNKGWSQRVLSYLLKVVKELRETVRGVLYNERLAVAEHVHCVGYGREC